MGDLIQTMSWPKSGAAFVAAHWPPALASPDDLHLIHLAGDGGDRTFMRAAVDDQTAILVHGPDPAENRAYEAIGRHLYELGRLSPAFYAADQDLGLFLMEDLGDFSLQDWVRATPNEARLSMYEDVVDLLAFLHDRGLDGFDPGWCYQTERYDRDLILEKEAEYFMERFVYGLMGLTRTDKRLAGEFEQLASAALTEVETTFMHRDFQSRNIMITRGRPRLLDFQGARLGPPGYDLASLLYDPYVNLDDNLRPKLLAAYIAGRRDRGEFDAASFERTFPLLAACRLLQALGAYGFLSRVKAKFVFRKYIPAAVNSLAGLLNDQIDFAPALTALVNAIQKDVGA